MNGGLGLSVGVASLVAARVGGTPVARRSVLTVFDHRPPEVGVPDDNASLTEPGLTLSGFIKRIGDPMPIVGPDGSTHRSDVLAAEALDAIARSAGYGAPVAVAVPGHWKPNAVAALRDALRPNAALSPGGVPPMLISDATTALAALYSRPGFPSDGVIVLCDFGASGTSITLTDAAANFPQIGETVRYTGFSGDQIDQAILNHLQSTNDGRTTTLTEPGGTLSGRLDDCRRAKEQLSAATVAVVGHDQDERLTRTDLEHLISGNLERLIDAVQETLQRNEIATSRLAAVATVGGGACIPLVTQQLEARLKVPVVTTPQPTLSAAIGAAVLAARRSAGGATTAIGVTSPVDMGAVAPNVVEGAAPNGNLAPNGNVAPNGMDPAPPTEIIPSAWASDAARGAGGESVADGVRSATYRALAWSQEASSGAEPVPYTGDDHSGEYNPSPPPAAPAVTPEPVAAEPVAAEPVESEPHRGLKRSGVVFGVAAIAALATLLTAGLVAHKMSSDHTGPVHNTTTVPSPSRLPSVGSLTPEPPPPPVQTSTEPSTTEEVAPQPVPSTTEQPTTTTTTPRTTTTTTTTTPTTVPTPSTNYSYPPVTPNYPYPVYPPATTPPRVAPPLPPLVPVRPTYGQ